MASTHRLQGHSSLNGALVAHYRVLEEMGVGGMGIVYKAEDQSSMEAAILGLHRVSVQVVGKRGASNALITEADTRLATIKRRIIQ